MIPERSEKAKYAKSVFFEEYNDIDIYIEDGAYGYKRIYVNIMARIFSGRYRVGEVFPLGNRRSVIDRCRVMGSAVKRPTLFVVDGDLYMLSGESLSSGHGLYILPFYSVENILLDLNAIYELICEEDPERRVCDLIKDFGYEDWFQRNIPLLVDLFVEYAMIYKFLPNIETVSYPLNKIISSNDGEVCKEKILSRVRELRGKLIGFLGEKQYYDEKKQVVEKIQTDGMEYISAKDYLFPLIRMRMKTLVRTNAPDINLKVRLSKICDVRCIGEITEYVISSK